MRCRRICRELLWLARFGEFGPSSQPHLDHLAGCQNCRDEVGYDREMVRRLRAALAARIEGMDPSPKAWESILRRAQAPEPGWVDAWLGRLGSVVGRLRTATAMAGTGLAVVLALNMEVIPVPAPQSDAAESGVTSLEQVPRMPTGRTALVAMTRPSDVAPGANRPDPEAVMTGVGARITPPSVVVSDEPVEEEPVTQLRLVFRPTQSPEPAHVDDRVPSQVSAGDQAPREAPPAMEPGQPS